MSGRTNAFVRWIVPAALFAALALDVRSSLGRIRAQRLVRAVEARTVAMIRAGRLERPLLAAHLAALADARRLDPSEVAIRVATGSEKLLLGDYAGARAAYEDALALEPRPEIHLNLGKALLGAGDREAAAIEFARALKGDPTLSAQIPKPKAAPDPAPPAPPPAGAPLTRPSPE